MPDIHVTDVKVQAVLFYPNPSRADVMYNKLASQFYEAVQYMRIFSTEGQ